METDDSASSALTELQDGVGTPLGLFVNTDGDFQALGEISSSLLAGIGNVTLYSASVDFRLDALETDTGSQDARLDALEAFTSSQEGINTELFAFTASINSFTSSTDDRLDNVELTTASLLSSITQINTYTQSASPIATGSLLVTASVNYTTFTFTKGDGSTFDLYADTGSLTTLSEFNSLTQSFNDFTQSTNLFTQSSEIRLDSLETFTGSYATTGSNTFNGNNVFSGSVRGAVNVLTITSQTASMDLSLGNFFDLTLPTSSVTTHLLATNIQPGQTTALRIITNGSGSISYNSTIDFPAGFQYTSSFVAATDILTFLSFDTSSLYSVASKRMI